MFSSISPSVFRFCKCGHLVECLQVGEPASGVVFIFIFLFLFYTHLIKIIANLLPSFKEKKIDLIRIRVRSENLYSIQ